MFHAQPSTHEDQACLGLAGELNIYFVTEARDLLSTALDAADGQHGLNLNLAGIEELDSAGVQLLVWLKQEARRRGKPLSLFAHSPAVVEVFDLLKVAGLFGDSILIAPSAS